MSTAPACALVFENPAELLRAAGGHEERRQLLRLLDVIDLGREIMPSKRHAAGNFTPVMIRLRLQMLARSRSDAAGTGVRADERSGRDTMLPVGIGCRDCMLIF